ncbi:MAG: hypothetical protein ABUL68_03720, partial [Pseudomonadota bacterium]
MILSLGCTFAYQVVAPTANFTFNILANAGPQQKLLSESVVCVPEVPEERISTSKGNRVFRVEVPAGPFELRYGATVEVTRPALPAELKPDNPGRLPLTVLTYTLPSRYCESDRFAHVA